MPNRNAASEDGALFSSVGQEKAERGEKALKTGAENIIGLRLKSKDSLGPTIFNKIEAQT